LQNLRDQAEASILLNPPAAPEPAQTLLAPDASKLIHELLVHQTELEMQNEELRRTQTNLTAANLLGVARQDLPMRPVSNDILRADQDIYCHHRIRLLATAKTQEFELRLLRVKADPFWAHLTLSSEQAITRPNTMGATGCGFIWMFSLYVCQRTDQGGALMHHGGHCARPFS
jgi:hypothetical protein